MKKLIFFTSILIIAGIFMAQSVSAQSAPICTDSAGHVVWPETGQSGQIPMGSASSNSLTKSGLTISGGKLYLNGTEIGGSVASYWTLSGSNIYNNNSGNVGIGTTNPGGWKLAVNGQTYTSGNLRTDGNMYIDGKVVIDDNAGWHRAYGSTGIYFADHGGGWYMADDTWIRAYGNKSILISGWVSAATGIVTKEIYSGGVGGVVYNPIRMRSNAWSGGASTKAITLTTYNTSGSSDALEKIAVYSGDTGNIFLNPSGGNVGIGNAAPTQKLDVSGNIKASGTVTGSDVCTAGGKCLSNSVNAPSSWNPNALTKWTDSGGFTSSRLEEEGQNRLTLNQFYAGTDKGLRIVGPQGDYVDIGSAGINVVAGRNNAGGNLIIARTGGNVGIGNITPTKKLDVVGDIRASGDICTTAGKCLSTAGSGTGTVGGSGTANALPKWTSASGLGDSTIVQGSAGNTTISGQLDSVFSLNRTGGAGGNYYNYMQWMRSGNRLWYSGMDSNGQFIIGADSDAPVKNVSISGANLTVGGSVAVAGNVAANGGVVIDGKTVIDDGAGWHRAYGNTGIYFADHGGGWNMEDSTWIRAYGGKSIFTSANMQANGTITSGGNITAGGSVTATKFCFSATNCITSVPSQESGWVKVGNIAQTKLGAEGVNTVQIKNTSGALILQISEE